MTRRSKKRVRRKRTRRHRVRRKRTRRRRRRKRLRHKTRRRGGMAGHRLDPPLVEKTNYSWRQNACKRIREVLPRDGPLFDCDKIKLYKMINGEIPYTRTEMFDEIRNNTQVKVEWAARARARVRAVFTSPRTRETMTRAEERASRAGWDRLLNQTLFLYGKPNKGILNILKNLVKQNNIRISNYIDGLLRAGRSKLARDEDGVGQPEATMQHIENENKNNKKNYTEALPMFMISIADITDKRRIRRYITTMSEVDNTTPEDQRPRNTKAEQYTSMLKNAGFCVGVDLPTGWEHDARTITSPAEERDPPQGGITYVIPHQYVDNMRYVPFKRLKVKKTSPLPQPTCNNGSLCSEPKLFSWLRNHKIPLADVHGYACMWIHNGGAGSFKTGSGYAPVAVNFGAPNVGLPEQHTLIKTGLPKRERAFVYKHSRGEAWKLIKEEALEIDGGDDEIMPMSCAPSPPPAAGGAPAGDADIHPKYLDQVVDWLAFPCPGCQMNYFDIVYGKPVAWDDRDCVLRKEDGEPLAPAKDVFSGHGGTEKYEGQDGQRQVLWKDGIFYPAPSPAGPAQRVRQQRIADQQEQQNRIGDAFLPPAPRRSVSAPSASPGPHWRAPAAVAPSNPAAAAARDEDRPGREHH